MGYRSRRRSEYLLVLQKRPIKAKGCWLIHSIPDVWQEKTPKMHPHSKSICLQAALIEATTQNNDYVLDPASGGYSVFSACMKTGRNFIGEDIEFGESQKYDDCDVGNNLARFVKDTQLSEEHLLQLNDYEKIQFALWIGQFGNALGAHSPNYFG